MQTIFEWSCIETKIISLIFRRAINQEGRPKVEDP